MALSMSTVKTLFQYSPVTEPKESPETLDGSPYDPEKDETDEYYPYIRVGEHQVGVAQAPLDTSERFPYDSQIVELGENRSYIKVGEHQVGVVEFPDSTGFYHHSLVNIVGQRVRYPPEELGDENDKDHAVIHIQETSPTTKENEEFLTAVEQEMMNFSALQESLISSSVADGHCGKSAVNNLKPTIPKKGSNVCFLRSWQLVVLKFSRFDSGSRASRVLSRIQQVQVTLYPLDFAWAPEQTQANPFELENPIIVRLLL